MVSAGSNHDSHSVWRYQPLNTRATKMGLKYFVDDKKENTGVFYTDCNKLITCCDKVNLVGLKNVCSAK